jgi:hemerythrin
LRWTPEQAVHVPEIDAEHQEMFRLAADLRQALLAGDKTGHMELLCRRLAAELNGHFSHEERLMRDAEYPAYEWHQRQHRTARAKMAALERDVHRGERQPIFDSLESLAAWIRDHTSVADRMVGSYLRNYWRAREFTALPV